MKVVRLRPGCAAEIIDIGPELEELQREVAGWIEILPTAVDGVVAVVNEEGELRQMAVNAVGLRGTVIFCRSKDGELLDLDDATVATCIEAIAQGRDLRQD